MSKVMFEFMIRPEALPGRDIWKSKKLFIRWHKMSLTLCEQKKLESSEVTLVTLAIVEWVISVGALR